MNDSVRPEIKKLSAEIDSFLVAAEAEREKHEREQAASDMAFEADNKDVAGFEDGSSDILESEDLASEDKLESVSNSDVDNISEDEENFEESDLEELF
ncbi:MAG: hypothetical protein IJH34_10185 [Romboutsia sp.]|nr:hypothetical protein [Romboutsia sp.]